MITFAPLGDVAEFINGFAFKPNDWGDEGRKIIRIQNLTAPNKPYNLTTRQVDSRYDVNKGDLLVSWSATLGVFEWSEPDTALLNQHIFKVVPKDQLVEKDYLRHALVKAIDDMNQYLRGSTMKHVNRGEFLGTKIPLPPLPEQRRIAAILDKGSAIRRKRQQAIRLTEEFLRSVFLDMFGDPVTNPKGWEVGTLGDVIYAAKDGPHVSPKYADGGIPFLSTRHVKPGKILWEDLKYLSQEEAEIQWKKCKPEKGDILYTKGGTTGLACVFDDDREIAVWVHVALLKTNHNIVDAAWLENMLNTSYCYFQSQKFTHGITNKDLGLKRMVKIKMYFPPLKEQKRFSKMVTKIRSWEANMRVSEEQNENFFNSLVQRAFRGDI